MTKYTGIDCAQASYEDPLLMSVLMLVRMLQTLTLTLIGGSGVDVGAHVPYDFYLLWGHRNHNISTTALTPT